MTAITRTVLVLAGLAGTLFITPAFAQTESSRGVLEEITVTAERREENLQDVPIAVTAMSRIQLEDLQVFEARDLQRYVPSLNMFNNVTSPTNLSLSMRGLLQQDGSLVTAESPIGMYVDDIYVARLNGNNVTLSDIERIEVLRGPQGTLYGRNTGFGAIKFISRTPGEDAWFDATVGGGNWDQLLFSASGGGPLGDSWAGSLAGRYYEKADQFTNVAENVDTGSEENLSLRGKLRYMGEKFDAVLSVSYSDSENDSLQMPNMTTPNVASDQQFTTDDLVPTNGDFTTNSPWGQLQAPPLGDKPHAETEQTIVGLTLTWDLSDTLTFKSITGYVGLEDSFHTDFNGDSGNPLQFLPAIGATVADSDQFTQEFQLLGTAMDDRLSYLVGAYYLNEEADQSFAWNAANVYDLDPTSPTFLMAICTQCFFPLSESVFETEVDAWAVFGDVSYNFTDNFRGTAGLRYTDDDKTFDMVFQSLIPPNFPPDPTLDPPELIPLAVQFDDWLPRVVLEYTFADSAVMLYGSAAKGFKGGGFSSIAITNTSAVVSYLPEENWTYAVGLKAEWLDSRLRTNLEYFFSDISEIQQNSTVDDGMGNLSFPVQNSGDAEIQGLEFEIVAVPTDGLNLFFSGSFLDGEYTKIDPGSAVGQAPALFNIPKAETPQTPDYAINIGFDYTIDFSGRVNSLSFGLDYYEIDDYVTAATNDFKNSGWDMTNGFIKLNIADNWELKLTGKNITDERIITSGSRGLGGFVYLYPEEYLFSVTYRM